MSVVALISLSLALPAAPSDASLHETLSTYCLDCHSGDRPKGQLDLEPLVEHPDDGKTALLRAVRDRLRRGDMPPAGKERPDEATYARLVSALNATIDERAAHAPPGRPTLRRLNRVEYRNTVRDLIGVDVDVAQALPADDVGEGFDHIGDVLSMAPTLLEKYFDVAERAALKAWPDEVASATRAVPAKELRIATSSGAVHGNDAVVWTNGEAVTEFEVPRDGRYRLRVTAFGDQAGGEPVKIALTSGTKRIAHFDIPEQRAAPGQRTCELTLRGGKRRVSVEFTNDFYREDLPENERDRNLHVVELALEGPIDVVGPTPALVALAPERPRLEPFVAALLERGFRRPTSADERAEFVARVRAALPDDAPWPLVARTAVTAALVDPRFLFRVERDPESSAAPRPLDDFEIASRLSYACWASMPDAALFDAARRGELTTTDGLRAALARLLDDPRSLALAERFGQQWLLVSGLEEKQPDAQRWPTVDAALLRDMKAETTLFVDRMIRERRPLRELLLADWTFLNERLARHYGIEGIDGDWMRLTRLGDQRVPGLLGHGSVLVATSNPTRTSPVKRGKWILDAILDAPPPPPPPGVPVLPEQPAGAAGTSMRDLLARHRSDPNCAACHRRMDAIGLALESLDAVGRARADDDGVAIDARSELPDGRVIDGPRMVATLLADDPALVRSVVRHLFVFVLGRSALAGDDAVVDRIARGLAPTSTIADALEAIVLSDQFRLRSAPMEAR